MNNTIKEQVSKHTQSDQQSVDVKKVTLCHHCGKQIVYNRTWPDPKNSHWAHAILVFGGKEHTLENALMEQRCSDNQHWATPRREYAK